MLRCEIQCKAFISQPSMSNGFIYVVDAYFIDKIEKKKKSWTQVPVSMMQEVIYNIRYVHNYNKTHLQKQNQTNNTQHRICEIHVSRYIFIFYCFW